MQEGTDDEGDEPFDMEAAKRAALASQPAFAGGNKSDKAAAQQLKQAGV